MTNTMTTPMMTRITPILMVDEIEPCLSFWTDHLGFIKENVVPGPDGKPVFASVRKDNIEIMYATKASAVSENPAAASELVGHSAMLFIALETLADLDAVEEAVKDAPMFKPRHTTFYGSTELYVREPGGTVVGFAAFTQ